jgi:hypothetical protein
LAVGLAHHPPPFRTLPTKAALNQDLSKRL